MDFFVTYEFAEKCMEQKGNELLRILVNDNT